MSMIFGLRTISLPKPNKIKITSIKVTYFMNNLYFDFLCTSYIIV